MQRKRILTAALLVMLAACGDMGDTNTGDKTGPGDGPVGDAGAQGPAETTYPSTDTASTGTAGQY
jgi:hypothetical protein